MDEYHDLGPVIDALTRSRAALDLHVVGDGEYRGRYEAMARAAGVSCRFHGRVAHHDVPNYIAAADLCIAPYRTDAFHGRRLTFSTLKIPEYMACARPVVGVPCDSVLRFITPGVSGFVAANNAAAWCEFLTAMPSREGLAAMGEAAAAAVQSVTWDATAASYLEACHRVIANDPACQSALAGQTGLSRL
jgi:glycosyltransferase involved in cell wall biosynthesis